MKTFLVASVMICAFVSCRKSSNPQPIGQGDVVVNQFDLSGVDPANTSNPFDSVGAWHNAGLKHVLKKMRWWDSGLAKIDEYTITYVRERLRFATPSTMVPVVNYIISDSSNGYRRVIDNSPFSDLAKTYLGSLMALTETKLVTPFQSINDYFEYKTAVVQLELAVTNDRRLDERGRKIILQVASVARYSAFYWICDSVQSGSNSPTMVFKLIKFLAKVSGDIAGAIGGFIDDATTGSIVAGAVESSAWWAWHIEHTTPFGG